MNATVLLCTHAPVLETVCEANVTKQPLMRLLLFILAVCCTIWWLECTVLRGVHFRWLHRSIRTKLLSFVVDVSNMPKYWVGIMSFVAGQGTAYAMNLLFEGAFKPFVEYVLCAEVDPLSLYVAVLIHDDICGSIVRFGTWSKVFQAWKRATGNTESNVLEAHPVKHSFAASDVGYVNVGFAAFSVFTWMVQVAASSLFAFSITCTSLVVFKEYSPLALLAHYFGLIYADSCIMKLASLAIPVRFVLEALHAFIAPYLIRAWNGDAAQTPIPVCTESHNEAML